MVGDMVGDSATKKLGSSVREHKNQYGYHLINGPPPEGLATRTHFILLVMTSEYTDALRTGQDLGYLGKTVIIGLAGLLNQTSCYRGGYLDPLIILRIVQRPIAFGAF